MRAIFISYRRSDTEGEAGRLSDLLMHRFSDKSVFMDVDSIQPGRDFRKAIDESIQACSVALVLIGPNWLDAHDECGNRRLDAPNDYVRLEIAAALHRDIAVIPVLLRNAKMPRDEQLPAEIADLAYRNSVELTHARWRSDLQILIDALEPLLGHTPADLDSGTDALAPTSTVAAPSAPAPSHPPSYTGPYQPHFTVPSTSIHRPATAPLHPAEHSHLVSPSHHTSSVIHPYRPPAAPTQAASHLHAPVPPPLSYTAHPDAHSGAHAALHHPTHSPETSAQHDPAISHAEVERVSRHLAHFIGPIAEIVVKRAAKKAATVDDLCASVSQEIETASDRNKFLHQCKH